jgi:hypothetical protein
MPARANREKDEQRLKELFKLWIEYLRRSDSYRQLCEFAKTVDFVLPSFLPERLKDKKELIDYYDALGDIFNSSFEELWARRQDYVSILDQANSSVKNWASLVEKDFDKCVSLFRKRHGKDPTLSQFKAMFLAMIRGSDGLYLKLRFSKTRIEQIQKKLVPILEEYQKGASRGFLHPTSHGRPDEIRTYLQVYDYDKKLPMKDIIRLMHPKDNVDDPVVLGNFYAYRACANKIMENVEKGIFPGKFRPRKRQV